MIEHRIYWNHCDIKVVGQISLPGQRIDAYLVATTLALPRNANEIPLQAAVREVLVQQKGEVQRLAGQYVSSLEILTH